MSQKKPMCKFKRPSNTTLLYLAILGSVPLVFIAYAGTLLWATWPISEFSINKSGVFGDSFGALTAFFSGLAFAGMIVTILLQRNELSLQREELKENRKEFERSASAQETNSKLSALTAVLIEYKAQIVENDNFFKKGGIVPTGNAVDRLKKETQELTRRKNAVLKEIEKILSSMGVEFDT